MEKVINIITAIVCVVLSIICFLAVYIDNITVLIQAAFVILILLILAAAPFKGAAQFGVLNNPIGRPIVLTFVSGFYFPNFNAFCSSGWISCLLNIAGIIGFVYGLVLLIINIVLMAMKKIDYKQC
ncbi:Transmembrane domain-containing protein [Spironucleus salmonicida]|uniref:Transmembrane domain-containing protein n=1 Tax=Spironucleus salmonicida TaxID=348837 RepID=A0A9P8LJE3_9EUKA|nr:Transmembrane domain-containing protein [Spironucleus salmonicida]